MSNVDTTEKLQAARDAVERDAWVEAYELYAPVAESTDLGAEDLEHMATAAWWSGHFEFCVEAREKAYRLFTSAQDNRGAARVALDLANDYRHQLASAISAGWLARAERLLVDERANQEYCLLLHARINHNLGDGALDKAYDQACEMLEVAERLKDRDQQALAIHDQGRILVRLGRVDEGMPLLDEAAVAAVSGELGAHATTTIYCNVISACRTLADYRRAGDWTEAAKRWCKRQAVSGFPGICRVYQAEIMRLRGDWADAEAEAQAAVDELKDWALDIVGAAFKEIGEIRLRLGDLEGADEAFRSSHETGEDPQPGLALLRLAQGNVKGAASSIRRSLDEMNDKLERARLLPAAVEIAIEAGDHDGAEASCQELNETVSAFDTPAMHAAANWARGATLLASRDAREAVKALRDSCRLWTEVDAPYECARARMTLGEAYRAEGDEESALLELRLARSTFERLGAIPGVQRATALIENPEAAHAGGSTGRETKTFMFTDICKSTNLVEALGDEAWEDLLHWHDQTLRLLFVEHQGEEIKQAGDGFFVAFTTPRAGIDCAVAIQRRLAEHRKQAGFSPQIRIGLHASEATRRGKDFGGRGVHVAARVGSMADAGEILCSEETLQLVDDVPYEVSGSRSVALKGISEPIDIVTIDWR
ncbi:MAG: hypothetical protein IH957_04020 [Chloroflexi bacterium]|nr:hypothetical protein [Chloroflexota bacterium]